MKAPQTPKHSKTRWILLGCGALAVLGIFCTLLGIVASYIIPTTPTPSLPPTAAPSPTLLPTDTPMPELPTDTPLPAPTETSVPIEPTLTPLLPPTAPPAPAGQCPGGCTEHLPGCDIKGNISVSTGEKIYHVPGQRDYEATEISPEKGERWFCIEEEARAAGWRRAQR